MNKLTSFLLAIAAILGLLAGCAQQDPAVEGDPAAAKEANEKNTAKPAPNGIEKPGLEAPSGKLEESK